MRALLLALALVIATLPAARADSPYRNQTLMSWDPGHGTQVEYYDHTGAWTFLWYPGNSHVLPGQALTARGPARPPELCFRYGPQIYEPLTPDSGGWQCAPLADHGRRIVDRAKGDVFGLAKGGAVPFQLPRERTTIGALRKGGGTAPAPSRQPATAAPSDPGGLSCESILANAERGPADMLMAGTTYFHGKHMGKPCVKVDYAKAFELVRRSGDTSTYASLLKILEQRAATGNPRAVAALRKLK